jgi:arginine/ornithine transport system substrate-binding protein
MKKQFKLLFMVFILGLQFFSNVQGASKKSSDKIRIGVEGAYPPFSEVDKDGKMKGFDIDISYALCKEMGVECTLVKQDWDGMIPALLAKKYDAIVASMSITPPREKQVAFTDKYYATPAKFVRKKGSGVDVTKEGMKGKTVGVQRASIHDTYLTALYGKDLKIKRYGKQDEAYLDMKAGRLDLLMADSLALSDGFLKKKGGDSYEFVGPDFSDKKYLGKGIGIAIRKEETALVERFNKAIKTIRSNGVYDTIRKKYFDFDIFGK